MKITDFALTRKTVSYVLSLLIIVGGIWAYQGLGRLEFPAFTIKTALITTQYPGASPLEVEQEVTEHLETAVQQMGEVDEIRSQSSAGLSIIFVDIKKQYSSRELPQIWDILRKKVNDAQTDLPAGAKTSVVNDDFGDEYGIFFALTGKGYTNKELENHADFLKRELLLVKDVAGVEIWGNQREVIYMNISRSRLAELGISIAQIVNTLNSQNTVSGAGKVLVADDYIRISPTGGFPNVEDLGELLVQGSGPGQLIYLKDVVTIERGYYTPPQWMMRFNGEPAVGIGISIVSTGNVVEMGQAVRERLKELEDRTPLGMELNIIAYQADTVSESLKDFIVNLIEAVIIVFLVLCFTMGLSSGVLMGAILLLTILGTFIFMQVFNINLQLISLGALILALGMLVDNAIVVTEGILIKVQQGMERRRAALETVSQTAWPLLGATVVAILAFAAIGTSKDNSGEFLGSLFQVMAISLGLSWVLAITLTPLFCVRFLPRPKTQKAPYGGVVFRVYRRFLDKCLSHRITTIMVLLAGLAGSIYGFGFVENSFFPASKRPQFLIDYWRPEGTHIDKTSEDLRRLEEYLKGFDQIESTTTFVGRGALRFLLTYSPEMPDTGYGQILVTVRDFRDIDGLIPIIRSHVLERFPDSETYFLKFQLGPGENPKIQARFQGPDPNALREISEKARKIISLDPLGTDIRDNWRQRVPVLRPQIQEASARRLGITRPNVAEALNMNFDGVTVGVYREKDEQIPIILRAPEEEREKVDQINDVVLFSPATGGAVPLRQLFSRVETEWEDPIIHRKDRRRTITVQWNTIKGNASVLLERLKPQLESIELPRGYTMEWGGEYERSSEAQHDLMRMVPVFGLAMFVIVLLLYNSIPQTLIVFLNLPMLTIGVTAGLLIAGEPFGFMCLLGFIGLSGMIIKNAVVLIDQINLEITSGKPAYQAVLDSSVSRVRPVSLAAFTTVLGMLPLLTDVFYAGMAVTIISGLTFATILTLVVAPVLYAMFYRIKKTKT